MESIFKKFNFDGDFDRAELYGEGHINETFAFYVKNAPVKRYLVQRINHKLFTNVDALMNNIRLVTDFCRSKVIERGGNPDRECLSLVYTKDNKSYYFDGTNYYRAYIFIEEATSHQIATPELFYESARAFGGFAKLLEDFDASRLYDILPDFHDTGIRYKNFEAALKADIKDRARFVKPEIEFYTSRKNICDIITTLLKSGKMPLKATHNDTKLNNVMIDDKSGKGIAVIDLDTVMKGSICYDFGDSIRFGCNSSYEDEKDLSKVNFLMDNYKAYSDGYLSSLGNSITKIERENLAWGAVLMTYECGIRFLTDYLNGDTYFRIKHENHNLDRTRTQMKLVAEMEKNFKEMERIIM